MFGVTILGNNSAIPAFDRHPTAQALTHDDQIFLIDCGEGTQTQLTKYKIRRSKINHIFISHLHGDHYFGLIGIITSFSLLGREQPLHLYGPPELKEIIDLQLKAADTKLKFSIHFEALQENGNIFDTGKVEVTSFPVKHRVPCWGFVFTEKKNLRKINKDKVVEYSIPAIFYKRLQAGEDYQTKSGDVVANEWVTIPNIPPRSYAYCADTLFDLSLTQIVKGVNLLYHEATYLSDLAQRAKDRFHSTAEQAAQIAMHAGVKRLIIGHFSSKYEDLSPFECEARATFKEAALAIEGITFRIL